jgi:hypothetical protein
VLGIELRLLQMVWPSGQSSAVSASASALLELAASLLSRVSSSSNADADSSGSMLVLHQRPGCPNDARGMSRARRSMLPHPRRSVETLQRSLLVLHQRPHRSGQRRRMQRTRWPMLLVQRRSAPTLRTIVLVLHQRPGCAGPGGRLPGKGWSMFRFEGRSVEELSPTPNADSTASTNTDPADHLYSRHSNNPDPAGPQNSDAVTKTWHPNTAENLHRKANGDADAINARYGHF